jgi:hypothetical protein
MFVVQTLPHLVTHLTSMFDNSPRVEVQLFRIAG